MKQALSWGMYISFNNDLTYPEWNQPHIDCLMACPWENLLIETDCPFAPPYEQKDERCESSDVRNVVRVIAELRGVSEDFVAETSYRNAMKLYRISE
jgi:TatD DNase family protein